MDESQAEPAKPRSTAEIFEDLRAIAQSDGALHEISSLIYRDDFVTVDRYDGHVVDCSEYRWSTLRLNKNEILLLLGLMVQSSTVRTFEVQPLGDEFAANADSLFREFHDRVSADVPSPFDLITHSIHEQEIWVGLCAREAIYYGAAGLYLHQFIKFSRKRYREDTKWFLQNIGISIDRIVDIAQFILDRIQAQITAVRQLRESGHHLTKADLTKSLLISKECVRRKFGCESDAFFDKFVTSITQANKEFIDPFSVNAVSLTPLIEMGDYLYVPLQYPLCESIYESPFFWMMDDKNYADLHAKHRGEFVEDTAADILCAIFGVENVHKNVKVAKSVRKRGGEIDVLVSFGEFVVVVQAKSKRVTIKARAGDADSLKTDFEGAIQHPYKQAVDCIDLIKAGANCIAEDGNELKLHTYPRFIPMVVLSDSFPASTSLSQVMLQKSDEVAPVIWDIGVLDCVARLLPSPIELLFYLKCRSDAFDYIVSDSEYNYLGYHIQSKLALPAGNDIGYLNRNSATIVDNFMTAADVGIEADRPVGILEQVNIPVVSELLTELKRGDPWIVSVVIELYNYSSDVLEDISKTVLDIRAELTETEKAIKAFSIPSESGGITYAVTRERNLKIDKAAYAIATRHKYDNKSDRWYLILDCVETERPIDILTALVWPWVEDDNEAKYSEWVATMFNSSVPEITVGASARARPKKL